MGPRSLRILIIDDDAARAAILEEGLRAAADGGGPPAFDVPRAVYTAAAARRPDLTGKGPG